MSNRSTITRRRFLLLGGAAGAGLLASGGLLALAAAPVPAVDYGQQTCGKENAVDKILVAYASRCGSTAEVAKAIGDRLCRRGEAVDVRSVEQVGDLSPYRAVVVGSAVRMARWLPAAVKFVERHRDALNRLPVAVFTVHTMALGDDEADRQERAAYLDSVRELITPQQEVFFAGKIDLARLNPLERLMAKAVRSVEGDLRDWDAIYAWADPLFL